MFRSATAFDKLLDKATSHLRLEPDWPAILQICDQIRQGDVQPKHALASIKKKLTNANPHVAMFALIVLESCVKNCGSLIHDEIGTKAYMEQLRDFVKTCTHENVKTKMLELIQAWAFAFRNSPKYRAVQDTMNIMKAEDYKFPALKESDAMFSADTAPEWMDGDCCHRCRVQFSIVQRKHHCRACGQVFCSQCSARTCTLPKFGIEKEVRVCEACYTKLSKPATPAKQNSVEELPVEYLTSSLAQQNQRSTLKPKGVQLVPEGNEKAPPPRKSEDELREEEELQLALALSQSEAESKKSGRSTTPTARVKNYSPPPAVRDAVSPPLDDVDPELARYLNRSYWENRTADESSPTAPATAQAIQNAEVEQNGVASDSEMEEFVRDLKSQVEIFVNRMKSNSSRGRSIANDSSVQKLFMNITAMHSKLLHYIQQQDDSRVYYEGLQDKLVQVKDARAALDALRDEHREKLRREAEMAERQRQHQMAQKLDIMRKKKQEYLQYQRQLTLQHIQEQEREMQVRQEQQKQQYLMGSQYGYMPAGGYENLPPAANFGLSSASVPPGFAHYPPMPQGMPQMMMPPQGYMQTPPVVSGPPGSMVRPVMMGMPPQAMASLQMMGPPGQGQMAGHPGQGQMAGHPGQGQMAGHPGQGQMAGHPGQGQVAGHPGQSQVAGPPGQMAGPPSQVPHGHILGPQGPMLMTQGQMQGPQGPMGQPQLPQGTMPNQSQPHMPQSGQNQVPPTQHQMVPGAPVSPTSNVPMQHVMMPPMGAPMGQPFLPQQSLPPQEQTAELISFD